MDEKRNSSGGLSGSPPYPQEAFSLFLLSHDPATNRFGYVSFSASYPAGDIVALSVDGSNVSMTVDYSPHSSVPANPAYYAHITGVISQGVMTGDFDECNPAPPGWIMFRGPFVLHLDAGSLQVSLNPVQAQQAGARWRRVGSAAWYESGDVESAVPVGSHAVEFKDVAGWTTPPNTDVTISASEIAHVTANYLLTTPWPGVFFDDFRYDSVLGTGKALLGSVAWEGRGSQHAWTSLGGEPANMSVSQERDGVLHLRCPAGSTGVGTWGAPNPSLHTAQCKFLSGTYACRVSFDNAPRDADDHVVQTFWLANYASSYAQRDSIYSEVDFEYLAHDFWGGRPTPCLYVTAHENNDNAPETKRDHALPHDLGAHDWIDLVMYVDSESSVAWRVYGADGSGLIDEADLGAANAGFAPEYFMHIWFNVWAQSGSVVKSDCTLSVDWVYFSASPQRHWQGIVEDVSLFRANAWGRVDTVPDHDPDTADTDGDGMVDTDEIAAGTSPTDLSSVFRMLNSEPSGDPSMLVIRWSSVGGKGYDILRSLNLLSGFTPLVSGIPAVPPLNCYTVRTDRVDKEFYRIRLSETE